MAHPFNNISHFFRKQKGWVLTEQFIPGRMVDQKMWLRLETFTDSFVLENETFRFWIKCCKSDTTI